MQYAALSQGMRKASGSSWVPQVFATKPVTPGHWKFTWGPGHGVEYMIDEDVTFDRIKQRFVAKSTVRHPK